MRTLTGLSFMAKALLRRNLVAAASALLALGFVAARPVRAQAPSPIHGTAGFETGLQVLATGIGTPTDSGDTNTCANSTQSCVNVNWGDGSSTPGLIQTRNHGTSYDVFGTHLYTKQGTYAVTISYYYDVCTTSFDLGVCVPKSIIPPQSGYQSELVTLTTTATITPPSKYVILSLGDSIASGEGNPNEPNNVGTNYPTWSFWDDAYSSGDDQSFVVGTTTSTCYKLVGIPTFPFFKIEPYSCTIPLTSPYPPDEYAEWPYQSFPCHRSSYAGPSQAGNQLVADNPSSGITFIHFACSGAATEAGDTAANDVEDVVGQLKIARARLAPYGSSIGILLISAGSNDLYGPTTFGNGFGDLVKYCLGADPTRCDVNNPMRAELAQSFNQLPTYYKNLAMEINCQQPPPFIGANGVTQDPAPDCTDPQQDVPKLVLFTEYMDPTHDQNGNFPTSRFQCGPAFVNLDYPGDFEFFYDDVVVPLDNEVDSVPSYAQQAGLGVPTYAVSGIAADFRDHGVCTGAGPFGGSQRWVNTGNDSQFLLGSGPPPDGSYTGQDSGTGIKANIQCGALHLNTPCDTEELNGMLHPNSAVLASTLGNAAFATPACNNGICGHEDYRNRILDAVYQFSPPVTTATATAGGGSYTFGTAAGGPVTVTLTASNPINNAGIGKTYYAVDNPQCGASFAVQGDPYDVPGCLVYTGPFTISSPGDHAVTFFSTNTAGFPIVEAISMPSGTPDAIQYSTPPLEGVLQAVHVSIGAPSQVSGSGVHLTAFLSSLTLNSQSQYVAVVNIKNGGEFAATGFTVTGELNGQDAISVAPGSVPAIPSGAFCAVTLTFPASAGASGSRGALIVKETYNGGTAGGGFRVTLP